MIKNLFPILLILFLRQHIYAQPISWSDKIIDFSSQKSKKGFSAAQATGKPSRYPNPSHSTCAWSPEFSETRSEEFLEAGFSTPMIPRQILIVENYNPGHLQRVFIYFSGHRVQEIPVTRSAFTGGPGRLLSIPLPPLKEPVESVKLIFDKPEMYNTYQIDAIGLSALERGPEIKLNEITDVSPATPEHLSDAINSPADEVCPVISPDGSTLYFDRKFYSGNIGEQKFDDIWLARRAGGSWLEAVNIGPPLNNEGVNFLCSISPDGNTALVGNTYGTGGSGPGVSLTKRTADGWEMPKQLVITDFFNANQYNEFTLAADGKTIVMTIQNDESLGLLDMYVSFLQADGSFSRPKHMGNTINTAGNEMTPFLAADGKTLYFSSNGFPGYGNQDIFMTRRLDNTWQNWTEPVNLGSKINTVEWESYYTIDAEAKWAYYASSLTTGSNLDIFRIKLPDTAKPENVIWLKGLITDRFDRSYIPAEISYQAVYDSTVVAFSNVLAGDTFALVIPQLNSYQITVHAAGYYAADTLIAVNRVDKFSTVRQDFSLIPKKTGVIIQMNNILFEANSDVFEDTSYYELNRIVKFLKENPDVSIEVRGHTNGLCDDHYCDQLSEKRAKSVTTYFISQGISTARLTYKGFGKSIPIADNKTAEGRKKNQRVEFMITKVE